MSVDSDKLEVKNHTTKGINAVNIHVSYRRHLLRTLAVLALLWATCGGFAQTDTSASLAVFPLESQEALLGVAVAERVATAVAERSASAEVLGPEVALALVPPFAVQNGFLNPLVFLGENQSVSSRTAAALLRDALGVDAALTGSIEFVEGRLELTFYLATPRGLQTFSATASEASPERLAETMLAVVEQRVLSTVDEDERAMGGSQGEPRENTIGTINLDTAYGDYVEALALLGGGLLEEAQAALERAVRRDGDNARYQQLLTAVKAALEGDVEATENRPLAATLALSAQPPNEAAARRIFQALSEQTDVPAYRTWLGLLQASADNPDEATEAFDDAASYPYGRAARALFATLNEEEGERGANIADDLERIVESESRGALLGAILVAQQLEDTDLEIRLATRLSRVAPSLPYGFERLSQIAFDEDRPLDAAQALVVATRLEPESDLYWTNLGWAYYLLERLDESEEASLRAVDLNPDEFIAWYNLGLTRAVTGRLDEAMNAYAEALSRDPEVDDAAIEDLENALDLYPDTPAVHFALATLYEAEDRGDDAIAQFERYLSQAEDAPSFTQQAEERLAVLRAPPAPLDIGEGARLSLGPSNLSAETFRPGDRLFPDFELFTPGAELPQEVTLTLRLADAQGATVQGATYSETFSIPGNAVALQIDDIGFTLPPNLEPGAYDLEVILSASRERRTSTTLPLEVTGEPSFARQLISQGVTLRGLASNRALYDERNLSLDNDALTQRLLTELSSNAEAAQDALPEVTTGRFEGLGGAELFNQSSVQDVRDFLTFLLAQQSEGELSVSFVDAYAQWALEGAPTP